MRIRKVNYILSGATLLCGAYFLLAQNVLAGEIKDMESEIRCCFKEAELKGQFIITLTKEYSRGQIELQLESPSGSKVGYEPSNKKFYKPAGNMAYAGSPPYIGDIADAEEYKRRNYIVRIKDTVKGAYTLRVIGVLDSAYYIVFRPGGLGDSAAVQHFGSNKGIELKRGEVHTYQFNGEFADIHDGSIFKNDPRHFRVTRIK